MEKRCDVSEKKKISDCTFLSAVSLALGSSANADAQ